MTTRSAPVPGKSSRRASARRQTIAAATKNPIGTRIAPHPSAPLMIERHQSTSDPPLEKSATSDRSPRRPRATPMMWSRTSARMRAPGVASRRLGVLRALAFLAIRPA